MGEAAGRDAGRFFVVCEFFFVGEGMGAIFVIEGDKWVAFVVCGHIVHFAVEVARCVVVTAVWAGGAAGGVGVPVSATVWEVRGLGGLTAKGA